MLTETFLERFEGVRGHDGQWTARCPAHDDRNASLTIAQGRDGQWLLTCWTGCTLEQIVHAVGLDVRDLFPSSSERALWNAPTVAQTLAGMALPTPRELDKYAQRLQRDKAMLERCWQAKGWRPSQLAAIGLGVVGDRVSIAVRTLEGELVNFLRYSVDGTAHGPKMLAEAGYPRTPLYLLVDDESPIWIVEGEADAISCSHLGLNVIGAPGASAKAQVRWLDVTRDRDVVICMDADDAGRRAAQRWARTVRDQARSVRVVELDGPTGYDVGELVLESRDDPQTGRARLLALAKGAPEWVDREVRVEALLHDVTDEEIADMKPGAPILRPAGGVRVRSIRWLWRERIPRGRVGIVFGPPGQGKSTLLAMLIAEVTRDGGRVLVASAEEDPETTIVPRLVAADAVLERVQLMSVRAQIGETNLSLPRDLEQLSDAMRGAALVLIDPLAAHLGDEVNSWSEQSVRAMVLAPLAWYARKTDCTVVTIMHLNKASGMDALSRISGSGGFGGAARFALLLGNHPDDVGKEHPRQVLVHVKASEGPRQRALVFRRNAIVVDAPDGDQIDTSVLELVDDQATVAPEAVLAITDPEEASAFAEAVEWLRGELVDGPKLSKRLLASCRERGDFSERTLRKAKRALGVTSERHPGEGWLWVPKMHQQRGGS